MVSSDPGHRYQFETELWLYTGEAAWHFVTLPHDIADAIAERADPTPGFGSVRVQAAIGDTTWRTSLFPDKESRSFVLPIKKAIRTTEHLTAGDTVTMTLELIDD